MSRRRPVAVPPLWTLALVVAMLAADPLRAVERVAFVTSVSGSGNLSTLPDAGGASGVAAGDAICRARAAAGGLPNAGAYRAWLSNDFTDAYCHVQGLGGKRANDCLGGTPAFAGPWYRSGFPTSQPATGGLNRLATSTRTFATTASRTSSRCSGTASNRATRIAGRPPCRDSRNGVLPFSPVNSDRRNRR